MATTTLFLLYLIPLSLFPLSSPLPTDVVLNTTITHLLITAHHHLAPPITEPTTTHGPHQHRRAPPSHHCCACNHHSRALRGSDPLPQSPAGHHLEIPEAPQ
ncbi:hypothetical protein RHMOL_Rhmol06G0171000 [Rhododendron molle]|uniref:Uncharacterized protein n=1 Tax=Rhododendron molle TaxID=49168 RepID=A0ACC0NED0_RHOML|nr:hypothetical protein RHMOL_Rhmol06G0171000 [Rhododendron molle]